MTMEGVGDGVGVGIDDDAGGEGRGGFEVGWLGVAGVVAENIGRPWAGGAGGREVRKEYRIVREGRTQCWPSSEAGSSWGTDVGGRGGRSLGMIGGFEGFVVGAADEGVDGGAAVEDGDGGAVAECGDGDFRGDDVAGGFAGGMVSADGDEVAFCGGGVGGSIRRGRWWWFWRCCPGFVAKGGMAFSGC